MNRRLLIGTCLSTVGLGSPAFAQATPADPSTTSTPAPATPPATAERAAVPQTPPPNQPAEIVVTAQKRSERLQEVPVAVTVVSGNALAVAPRPSLETATQLVPSLNFLKSGTTLNQTIFLRGVGTASFSIAGEPSVSTVVDGVVYARSGEAFSDLIDIDQMEVLRGPQGTLFGKNASAGVINITTKQPTTQLGGLIEGSYFTRDEVRVRGVLNVPLGQDLLSRWTAFYGTYDGNIRNLATGTHVNGYRHYGARGQITYEPSDRLKIALIGDYHHNNDDCCAEIIATPPLNANGNPTTSIISAALPTPRGDDTRQISQNLVTSTKETSWGLSGQADIGVGTNTLTSITAYRKWNNTEIRDGDFLPEAYVGFNQLHDFGPQKSNTFTEEVRLTSPAKQFLSYVLGGYYSRAKSERIFTRDDVVCTAVAGATGLIPCGSANANPSTFPNGTADFGSTFTNLAAFGQATLNFSPRFRFAGGLRYSHDKLAVFHSRVSPLTGPGIQPNFDQGVYDQYLALVASGVSPSVAVNSAVAASNGIPWRTSTTHDNLSGKAALQYDFSRRVMGYVSYTRGYKGPAYNVFYNLTATGTNVIAPETSDSYEAGLKNTLFGGTLVFNIDAFYAKYHNFQANNPDVVAGVVVTRFTNAGEVSTRGVEADLYWRPLDGLTISGGAAYTDAHVDQFFVAPGAPASAVITAGTPLSYAPKWKGSLSADYKIRNSGPLIYYLGASGNAQTKQLSVFAPSPVQRELGLIKGYSIFNLYAGISDRLDRYRLTFQVRNLFNTHYVAAIQPGGPAGSYRYQIPRDADRYYGVSLRASF
ncbi:MAG TPA: TonB-dependent receptor [Sphingomicrobium sp.]